MAQQVKNIWLKQRRKEQVKFLDENIKSKIERLQKIKEVKLKFEVIKKEREKTQTRVAFAQTYKDFISFERLKKEEIKVSGYRRKDGTVVRPSRRKDMVLGAFMPPTVQKATAVATSPTTRKVGSQLAQTRLGQEIVEKGEIPERKRVASESLRQTGDFLIDALRNPKRAIQRGRERERAVLAAISEQAGQEVTKADVIKSGMGHVVDQIKSLEASQVQGVTEGLGANIIGNFTAPLGVALGPAGMLGAGYVGEAAGKKGIRDAFATKEAYDSLKGTEAFDQKGRIGQFKEVMDTARNLVGQRTAERLESGEALVELQGDNAGFIVGNATGQAFSFIPIPGKGAVTGIPASILGETWERTRQQGMGPLEAAHAVTLAKIQEGNAREQRVREEFKKRFPSMQQIASRIVKAKTQDLNIESNEQQQTDNVISLDEQRQKREADSAIAA